VSVGDDTRVSVRLARLHCYVSIVCVRGARASSRSRQIVLAAVRADQRRHQRHRVGRVRGRYALRLLLWPAALAGVCRRRQRLGGGLLADVHGAGVTRAWSCSVLAARGHECARRQARSAIAAARFASGSSAKIAQQCGACRRVGDPVAAQEAPAVAVDVLRLLRQANCDEHNAT
jgi:hypothetical protein